MRGAKNARARTLARLLKPGAVALLALSSLATTGGTSAFAAAAPAPATSGTTGTTAMTGTTSPTTPPTPAPTPGPAGTTSASKPAPAQPAYPQPKTSPRPAQTAGQKAAQARQDAESAARAKARSTGKAVPVDVDTTEKTTVAANPDGSFTSTTSLNAQRVLQNGAWATLDPTLVAQTDGRVRTTATTLAVSFSGGGTAPLAVVDDRKGHVLTLTWPTALPKPTVSGPSAVYADVLPGVDLKLTATVYAFSDVLIVHDAKAAANPALKTIRMGMSGSGLTVGAGAAGGVNVTDAAGKPVFQGPAPALWDSYRAGAADAASPAVPGPDADVTALPPGHRSAMPAKAVAGGIELTPDPAVLTNPGAAFPIIIDPEIGPAEPDDYYAELWSCAAWKTDTFIGGPGIGLISYPGDGGGTNTHVFRTGYYPNTPSASCPGPVRSMLEFDVRDVSAEAGKVNWAAIDLNQQSGTCTATQIWTADPISTRPPSWYNTATVDGFWQGSRMPGFGSCSNTAINKVEFNVSSWVTQLAACGAQTCPTATVGLRTDNESAGHFEAFYAQGNGNLDPSITVNYFVPPRIDSLWMDGTGTYLPKLPGAGPSYGIHASVSDQDSGHDFKVAFTVGPNTAQGGATATNSTGTQIDARIPAQGLTDGASYQITATVQDVSTGMSASASGLTYTVAWSPPLQPAVTSGTTSAGVPYFPPSGSGQQAALNAGAAQTGAFHVRSGPTGPPGSPGVNYFDYVIDGDSSQAGSPSCSAPVQCGRLYASSSNDGTIDLNPGITHSGMNHLFLKTVDQAGNVSWNTEYDFFVPGLFQPTVWGNVTGTGIPDIMAIAPADPSKPNGPQHLVTFPTNQDPTKSTGGWAGSWIESAPATAAPDHTSWAGSLITHRGSQRVQPVDDMFAWKNGSLYYYDNVVGTGGTASEAFNNTMLTVITRPVCPACGPTYHGGDWSTVKQILALGPAKGGVPGTSSGKTSLITVEDDGRQGANLWLFPTVGQGAVGAPTMIASCSTAIPGVAPCPAGWNWADTTLVAPGNAAGHPAGSDGKATSGLPDLWVRDNNAGTLWMFPNRVTNGVEDPTGFGDFTTRVQLGAAGQFNAKSFPELFSNGNVEQNGNGKPDLFALTPNGQLTLIQAPANTGGAAIPTTRMQTMSSAGWAGSYGFSSVDASPVTAAAGAFTLTPAAGSPSRCLDNKREVASNGNAVQVYQCNATIAQAWTFASDGTVRWMGSTDSDGRYNMCLDVEADSTTGMGMFPGTPVQLWTCNTSINNGGNEKWQVRLDPSGKGALYNPESGLCLDDPNSSTDLGTRFQIWNCWDGNAAQLWDFPTAAVTSIGAEAENLLAEPNPAAPLVVQGNCCGVSWSNGQQLWFQATAPNAAFGVDYFVPAAGAYAIVPRMTKAPNYGQVQLAIDGTALPNTFDGYSPTVTTASFQFGTAKLSAGLHKFTFTATGKNAASANYEAGVDTLNLNWTTDTDPVISVQFPASGAVGVGLTVDASASQGGANAIAGYGFDFGDGTTPVTGTAATAAHTYTAPGTYTVTVTATDSAGGVSTAVKALTVSSGPTSWWKLNDGSGTTAADSGTGAGHPAAVNTGASLAPGGYGVFDGSTGYAATAAPAVDTTRSFAVAAWVDLGNLNGSQTFVTQQGTQAGGFHLEFKNLGSGGTIWTFGRVVSDAANTGLYYASSPAGMPAAQTWTHLIGSWDATTGTMALYVNGKLVGSATDNAPVASNGPLVIGRGFYNATANNFVAGGIADVRVYQQAFGGDLASWLYQNTGFTPPAAPVYGIATPQALTSSDGTAAGCSTDPAHPATSTSATPALGATLADATLHADFEMRDVTDPYVAPPLYYGGTGSASGTGNAVSITTPTLTNGHEYAWSARAHNSGSGVSATAKYCYVRISVGGAAAATPTGAAGAFFDNTVIPASAGPTSWSGPLTTLVWQTDGNLVLYKKNGQPIWNSNTAGNPGATLALQSDGNLVVRSGWPLADATGRLYGGSLWSSATAGKKSYDLVVQTDGNAVVYSPTGALFGMNGNVWNIADAAVGRCLDSNAQGQLYSNPCASSNGYQNWIITDNGNGTLSFRDSATGLCLDGNGTNLYTGSCGAGNSYQQWYETWGGSGWILKHAASGKVLDMQTDGTPYFNTLNGGAYQQWD